MTMNGKTYTLYTVQIHVESTLRGLLYRSTFMCTYMYIQYISQTLNQTLIITLGPTCIICFNPGKH